MAIERQGDETTVYTHHYPRVIGGICEWCGVKDSSKPSTEQYKLCDHFKNMGELRCSYCPETKNPTDVVYHAELNIHDHPDRPGVQIVVCNAFECAQKHLARFKIST